jgi:hypothetical protein
MQWRQLAPDVALLQYPWRVLGIDFARNVTLLRLADGRLVIHSTAPFSPHDVAAIRRFGEPAWLVEATRMHDTFARKGRAAFPDLPYLAPAGVAKAAPLQPPPRAWSDEIEVLAIEGTRTREHAFFHRRSRTLVVADLVFHFPAEITGWPRLFVRQIMRLSRLAGVSVFFRLTIRDHAAFAQSLQRLLARDFDRVIVAHREPILSNPRATLEQSFADWPAL